MADETVVHIGENSPEEVALKLFHIIGRVENRDEYGHGDNPMDREWILRTYSQCRMVVERGISIDRILEHYRPEPAQRRHS